MKPLRAFVSPHTKLGESPLYRPEDKTLHYIDVLGCTIHIVRLDDLTQRRAIKCPEPITFLCFHRNGGYIVCSFSSVVRVSDTGDWHVLQRILENTSQCRLNDAGVDSKGRLWIGSIDLVGECQPKSSFDVQRYEGKGCIYRYEPDGTLAIMQEGGVIGGNGFGWSPSERYMYFVDSYLNCIWRYDFDVSSGQISNRHKLIERQIEDGGADGLLVDQGNNLYTFLWDGAAVVQYSAAGRILREWKLNASRVTNGAWVGEKMKDMVVTSALQDDGRPSWTGEEAGGLFYIRDCGEPGIIKHAVP